MLTIWDTCRYLLSAIMETQLDQLRPSFWPSYALEVQRSNTRITRFCFIVPLDLAIFLAGSSWLILHLCSACKVTGCTLQGNTEAVVHAHNSVQVHEHCGVSCGIFAHAQYKRQSWMHTERIFEYLVYTVQRIVCTCTDSDCRVTIK